MTDPTAPDTGPDTEALRAVVDAILESWSAGQAEEISLDDDGEAVIAIRDDVQVSIQVPEDCARVLAFAAIAPMPEDYQARIRVIEDVLKFNLAQQSLGGGAVGADPDGGALFFTTSAPAATFSETLLDDMLEAAFMTVVLVREQIGFDPDAEMPEADEDSDDELEQLLKV